MGSKIKWIVISSILLVVLIGAVIGLKLTEKPKTGGEDSSASNITSKLMYEKKPEDVLEVIINNLNGEYTVKQLENGQYIVPGFEDVNLDSEIITAIIDAATSMTTQRIVEENASDLTEYGLTDNATHVTVKFKDSGNTIKEFLLGSPSFKKGESYMSFKGENTVYTVFDSAILPFIENDKFSTVSKTVIEGAEEKPIVQEMVIHRFDMENDIKIGYDSVNETNVIVEPLNVQVNPTNKEALVNGFFGLRANGVISVKPSEEELIAAGFNEPSGTITAKTDSGSFALILGDGVSDNSGKIVGYYGILSGTDIIYLFNDSQLPWMFLSSMEMIDDKLVSARTYEVEKLVINAGAITETFDCTGSTQADFIVLRNGSDFDKDYFAELFKFIKMGSAEATAVKMPKTDLADAVISVTKSNGSSQKIEFFADEDRLSIVKINGKPTFTIRTAYVERLISNLSLLDDMGEIVSNW